MIRHLVYFFMLLVLLDPMPCAWAQDPTPAPSADAPVRPVLTSKFWKTLARDVAIPAVTGVGGGVAGWHLTRHLLKTGIGGALGSVMSPFLLKSLGAAAVGIPALVLTNYLFNKYRERKVRAAEAQYQLPSERQPGQYVDKLPPEPGARNDPGFDDLPVDQEFPR